MSKEDRRRLRVTTIRRAERWRTAALLCSIACVVAIVVTGTSDSFVAAGIALVAMVGALIATFHGLTFSTVFYFHGNDPDVVAQTLDIIRGVHPDARVTKRHSAKAVIEPSSHSKSTLIITWRPQHQMIRVTLKSGVPGAGELAREPLRNRALAWDAILHRVQEQQLTRPNALG